MLKMIDNTVPIKPKLKNWIVYNLRRGVDKRYIFKILLEQHMDYNIVKKLLQIDYKLSPKK